MTMFWIVFAGMILAALALTVPVLLRRTEAVELDRERQNVAIARERLAELQGELDAGRLSQEAFEASEAELEQALLQDLNAEEEVAPSREDSGAHGRIAMLLLVVLVPLLTVSIYLFLGSPQLAGLSSGGRVSGTPSGGHEMPGTVDEMVAKLEQRLAQDPQNADGWFMLGRSYMATQQYAKAAMAFDRLYQLVGEEPDAMLALADALIRSQDGSTAGRPAELVRQAVALKPDSTTGLWLAGLVEGEAGNFPKALEYWRRLETMLEEDSESRRKLHELIEGLEQKLE